MFGIKELRRLREQVAALNTEASKILEGAASREGDQRALQDSEKDRLRAIKAELDRLNPIVAEAEEHVEGQREAAEASRARRERRVSADQVAPPRAEDGPRGAFYGLGDYVSAMAITALARAGRTTLDGAPIRADERYEAAEAAVQAATGRISTDVPQEGNILVGLQYSGVLMTRVWEQGEIRRRCSVQDVGDGFDGVWLPYLDEKDRAAGKRWGGVTVYWGEDGLPVDTTKPTGIKASEIRVKDLRGLVRIPEKLLRDAAALGSYIMRAVPAEILYQLEDAVFDGDGKGKPLGIFRSPALIKVAKEGGQGAKTVLAENFIKAHARFKPRDISRAAIFVNQELVEQLPTLSVAVGTGGQLVYMPPGGLSGSKYGTIFGLPVIPVEQCKGAGTVGDALMADLSEYLLVLKGGVQMATSLHLWFDTHDMAIRFLLELNGQPEIDGPIKPANAANANFRISPFVAFDTRS